MTHAISYMHGENKVGEYSDEPGTERGEDIKRKREGNEDQKLGEARRRRRVFEYLSYFVREELHDYYIVICVQCTKHFVFQWIVGYCKVAAA